MDMILFLARGLLRDRSRSLFPFITVSLGVSLVVIVDCYVQGSTDLMLTTTASFAYGHLRVATRAYNRSGADPTGEATLLGADSTLTELKRMFPDCIWVSRIKFGGLIDVPDSNGQTRLQYPVSGLAVDLSPQSPEHQLLRLQRSLATGRLPPSPAEVLLSDTLAKRLGVSAGSRLTLLSTTLNGALAVRDFTLSGTVRFGIGQLDRSIMLASTEGIREALDMADATSEILGFLPGGHYDEQKAKQIVAAYNLRHPQQGEFDPEMVTMRTASGLGSMFDLISTASALIIAVFVLAMSVVLWNAGLMGILRRYGEIGIRLAIGESKSDVYRSLLAESALLGLAGSVTGTIVGLGFSYYLQEVGINISGMMGNATILIDDVLRARISHRSYLVGFLPGLLATLLGAAISGLMVLRRQTAQLARELAG